MYSLFIFCCKNDRAGWKIIAYFGCEYANLIGTPDYMPSINSDNWELEIELTGQSTCLWFLGDRQHWPYFSALNLDENEI